MSTINPALLSLTPSPSTSSASFSDDDSGSPLNATIQIPTLPVELAKNTSDSGSVSPPALSHQSPAVLVLRQPTPSTSHRTSTPALPQESVPKMPRKFRLVYEDPQSATTSTSVFRHYPQDLAGPSRAPTPPITTRRRGATSSNPQKKSFTWIQSFSDAPGTASGPATLGATQVPPVTSRNDSLPFPRSTGSMSDAVSWARVMKDLGPDAEPSDNAHHDLHPSQGAPARRRRKIQPPRLPSAAIQRIMSYPHPNPSHLPNTWSPMQSAAAIPNHVGHPSGSTQSQTKALVGPTKVALPPSILRRQLAEDMAETSSSSRRRIKHSETSEPSGFKGLTDSSRLESRHNQELVETQSENHTQGNAAGKRRRTSSDAEEASGTTTTEPLAKRRKRGPQKPKPTFTDEDGQPLARLMPFKGKKKGMLRWTHTYTTEMMQEAQMMKERALEEQ